MSILVFLGLSILDLGPMYATDRQTSGTVLRALLLYTIVLEKRRAGLFIQLDL